MRILLVDDNADAVEMLAVLLRCDGHDVVVAYDGTVGRATFETFKPQLAIFDIGLPGMDGYALAEVVRNGSSGSSRPLIALSAYNSSTHRERAQRAGFDHVLCKPTDLSELRDLIQRYETSSPD